MENPTSSSFEAVHSGGAGLSRSPWFAMWIRPRETIQRIVDTDPKRSVLMLAALSGLATSLNQRCRSNAGDTLSLSEIFSGSVLQGPVVGLVVLYLGAFMIRLTGKWLGGTASLVTIRAALA